MFSINQLWGITGESLKLGDILKDCHVLSLELLEFYSLLPLDVRGNILLTKLILKLRWSKLGHLQCSDKHP